MKLHAKMYSIVIGLTVLLFGAAVSEGASFTRAVPKPTPATASQQSVAAEYKRLLALRDKLDKIPMEKLDREPNKSYIKRNKKDIVYSDPAGQWFVRADRFWNLAKRNRSLALSDDIAWTAAQTPLPGECEGYLNCYIFNENATLGEYLRMYPAGKHSKKALSQFVEWVSPMVAPDAKSTYDGPTEASDKAELHKMISELRATFAKIKGAGKDEPLSLLGKLEATYK